MKLKLNYNHTIYACYIGYVTQAIVNNFAPLLFLTFQKSFAISLDKIAFLVTLNFGIQLIVDLLSAKFVDKIGYRAAAVAAHVFAAAGLVGLTVLPDLFPDPYWGLVTAIFLYAIGGGMTEVIISPIVEACPTQRKEAAMSLLHSFYCWGHVFVVLSSTLFFVTVGIDSWQLLACLWAVVPFLNIFYFLHVPIQSLVTENEGMAVPQMIRKPLFWVLMLLMVCAGASEQGMSQWASAFTEAGLHVSKTVGDLAGPCSFAVLMGLSRVLYAKYSEKMQLQLFMMGSSLLCIFSYLMASLTQNPVLGMIGCGLCGLSVGILWPGTFSMAAKHMRSGGTAMFALLALAGDLGCSAGPTLVGVVSDACQGDLKRGLLAAAIFPILLILGLLLCKAVFKRETGKSYKASIE